MALLDDTREALRITGEDFDEEIKDLIDAAKADLALSGAKNIDPDADPLAKRAIILYAKSNFGLSNPNMEQYQRSYDRLKILLGTSRKYYE